MFHSFTEEWNWIEAYYRKYKKAPTRLSFCHKFSDFTIYKTDDTDFFSDEVRRAHIRMQFIDTINEIADLLADDDIDTALKKASSSIVQIAAQTGSDHDSDIFSNFDDVVADVESRVQRVKDHGTSGIPTGIASIDETTGGSNPGELWVLGARLGSGKSWVLQYMAATAATAGYSVQFDALEQTRSAVAMRIHTLLSSSAGKYVFQTTNLMQGKDFDLAKYKAFVRGLKTHVKGKLHVSDTSRGLVSPMTVMAQIEKNQPDVVFIDYLTLMQKSGPDWQGVAQLSSELKSLAARYGIPIWAAAQLNREFGITKEIPGTEALAQSDAIGQDADGVVTQRQFSKSVIGMKMAKFRNGPSGFKWWMQFNPGDGVIKEVGWSKAQDLMDDDRDQAAAQEEKGRAKK
jgi:replicative DNA helicase